VALRVAFPWRGVVGAALGGDARQAAMTSPTSVREEEEGARWPKGRAGRWGSLADWAEDWGKILSE
jgi:hypothetical protein